MVGYGHRMSYVPPLLRALCERFADDLREVDSINDAELYAEVVFSESATSSDRCGGGDEELASSDLLSRVESRLNSGWFAERAIPHPQARYASGPELQVVDLWEPEDWPGMAAKPHGALWTSSFLPDGAPAWSWGEPKVARGSKRDCYELHFRADEVEAYTIDSLPDYLELVRGFPAFTSDGKINVHWSRVAKVFDAVRLSARGLVHTAGVESEVKGRPTVLHGWESESTAWLTVPPGAALRAVG